MYLPAALMSLVPAYCPGESSGPEVPLRHAHTSGSSVKNLASMQETQVQSLCWEDPLEKAVATHSSTAWRIPWTEEPDGLQSMGSQRVRHG